MLYLYVNNTALAKPKQFNLRPAPPKYPPSFPSISNTGQGGHVIFVEGNVQGVALQGAPVIEYLLQTEDGFYLLAENGDNLIANK